MEVRRSQGALEGGLAALLLLATEFLLVTEAGHGHADDHD